MKSKDADKYNYEFKFFVDKGEAERIQQRISDLLSDRIHFDDGPLSSIVVTIMRIVMDDVVEMCQRVVAEDAKDMVSCGDTTGSSFVEDFNERILSNAASAIYVAKFVQKSFMELVNLLRATEGKGS